METVCRRLLRLSHGLTGPFSTVKPEAEWPGPARSLSHVLFAPPTEKFSRSLRFCCRAALVATVHTVQTCLKLSVADDRLSTRQPPAGVQRDPRILHVLFFAASGGSSQFWSWPPSRCHTLSPSCSTCCHPHALRMVAIPFLSRAAPAAVTPDQLPPARGAAVLARSTLAALSGLVFQSGLPAMSYPTDVTRDILPKVRLRGDYALSSERFSPKGTHVPASSHFGRGSAKIGC